MDAVTIVRSELEGTLTASMSYEGHPNDMSVQNMNKNVSLMLHKLADVLANEHEYEFDGVKEVSFDNGRMTLELDLFVP